MATASSAPPLVGRAAELARLETTLAVVEGGRSQTVLLVGEGGVGKTRLARAAADAAAWRGFAVAEGRAYSVESGVPYAVFADALAPTLRRLESGALNVLTRGASAELAHIFPGLISAAPHAERGTSGESAAEAKARLYWTFVQLVGRLAARQPLLLLLDNLQWADAASLELLHFVARQAHEPGVGGRLMVIGVYNDAEGPVPTLLRDAEHSLVALGAARVERVAPLAAEQTLELVQRSFDAPADVVRGFAAMLHEWTRGNPFFVEETIKSLVESGRLQQREGRWTGWSVESIALPRSVRDAVLARAERLGGDARALLDVAAVLGARVRYATLRAVRDAPDDAVLESLDELLRARLLVESGAADHDGYDFSHPLVRDAVYGAIGRPKAQRLHAQIAEALERLYGAQALAHADELAFHFARSGAGAANRKALHYLAESGRRALERYADRAAATYLESALELIAADDGAHPDGDRLRPAVLEGLARARQRLGEHEVAESLWLRVRQGAQERGDRRNVAVVERRLGLMHAAGGRHDRALERYDAGLSEATEAGDDALATRIRLARATSLQAIGRRDDARRDVLAALDSAIAGGDEPLLARVHRAMLLLHLWSGPIADARTHGERAVALAAESGERLVEWSAHWAMAILGGLTGDAVSTAHHVRESERLADAVRSPVLRLWTDEVAIEYMAGIGEWAAALARAEQAIPAARALGQRTLLARVLVWTGLIHRGLGDVERTREHIEEAWQLVGGDGSWERPLDVHAVVPAHTGMSGYLMLLGENERAVQIGERGLAIADRTGDIAWAIYRLLPFVIENSLYLEDYERAARHNERLRRESERLGHALGLAWADATDALLTYLSGNARDAVPLLRAAASALEAVPFVFDAARLRRLIGRAMVDAGDRESAERELRGAYEVFVRLGAQREIRATREQLRALGVRPPAAVAASGAGSLSGREAEIARLVAARKSNKEIGAALDISPRTVSTHLSNIFTKLGVGSRGELTDLVRTGGLG